MSLKIEEEAHHQLVSRNITLQFVAQCVAHSTPTKFYFFVCLFIQIGDLKDRGGSLSPDNSAEHYFAVCCTVHCCTSNFSKGQRKQHKVRRILHDIGFKG